MPQPTPSDVHIDSALTNMSVAFIQSDTHFIAGQVFPVVPVPKQTNKFFTYDRNDFLRDEMKKRAPATESAGGGYTISSDSYSCDVFAFHKDVDEQIIANQDPAIDSEEDATDFVSQKALIRRERQFATDYFATGKWTTEVAGGTNFTYWDNEASSDPIEDMKDGRVTILKNTGFMPNILTVGFEVHEALKKHPLIKDIFKYTSSESITETMLARIFEVEKYLVAKAVYATNEEGATAVYDFVAGKNAMLTYSAPVPRLKHPSAGYNFVWSAFTGLNNMGVRIKNFPIPRLSILSRVEIEMAFDMKIVSADLGYFFLGAVS